eukprot:CCRYP_009328-RB/>CCRYP_009328-RB protein AED:0.02 eAED:0.02 QI:559/1/1/1/0/0/2/1125/79
MALHVNARLAAEVRIRCSAHAPAVLNRTRPHATVALALTLTRRIALVEVAPPFTLRFASALHAPDLILPTVIVLSACRW